MKELFSEGYGAQAVRHGNAVSTGTPAKASAPQLSRCGKWIGRAALWGLLLGLLCYGDPALRTGLAIVISVWSYSRMLRSRRESKGCI